MELKKFLQQSSQQQLEDCLDDTTHFIGQDAREQIRLELHNRFVQKAAMSKAKAKGKERHNEQRT